MVQRLSRDQGRVRLSLFLSARKYVLSRATGLAPSWLPLHISVFLFFSGLVIFLFTVSYIIATIVAVCVGSLGLAYFALTIIPTFYDLCPYFTPMSNGWWYFWHNTLSFVSLVLRWLCKKIYGCLVPYNTGGISSAPPRKRVIPLQSHLRRLKLIQ